jgi:ribonuclease VapC
MRFLTTTTAGCPSDRSSTRLPLNKEPGRDRFLDVLANDDRVIVSAVTLYEAMLVAAVRRGPDNVSDLAQILETVQAEIVPFDADQARAAQAVYMRYGKGMHPTARLHLCDCLAYTLAKHLNVPLLFKGDDFAATDIAPA